jgi:hypothetical protein
VIQQVSLREGLKETIDYYLNEFTKWKKQTKF